MTDTASGSLRGKVAAVLNDRELVLNIGTAKGVQQGMKFRVLEPYAEVRDPDSDEIIGVVAREKVRVKVVEVQERMSIARTYQTYRVNVGGLGLDVSRAFRMPDLWNPPSYETRVRTLRYDDKAVPFGSLDPDNSIVKTGDPVELVVDEERS